jgi:lipopolysaccharide transport system ATP-binding protein
VGSEPAIRVDRLGKRYRLAAGGGPRSRYRTLRESLASAAAGVLRRPPADAGRDFWALEDVSFEVQPGEVVGVIGRNGAGKSTLLKILSRITKPTAGRVELGGRVGSLLEVGTGFHPELTGRENVFLNGSILGMSRREIAAKFDAIVQFAEVERFLDTPVKRYSSGMYVRLAFAVAAHLEPEILIVDEVLAVGDAAFQKRCLGKMGEVARGGRTVLLVSHNTAAVRNLCTRGVLLGGGRVVRAGSAAEVLEEYLRDGPTDGRAEFDLAGVPRAGGLAPVLRRVRLLSGGRPAAGVLAGAPLRIEFRLRFPRPAATPQVGVGVNDGWGQRVFSVTSYLSPADLPPLAGDCVVRCDIPAVDLAPGRYALSLSVGSSPTELLDQVEGVVGLDVEAADFYGNGRPPHPGLGPALVRSGWSAGPAEAADAPD